MALFEDLWKKFSGDDAPAAVKLEHDELRIASAALLVHAARADGVIAASELSQISWLLKERFTLSDAETEELLLIGEAKEEDAVDLYGFTSVMRRHLDQDGRQHVVRMLWEIVYADRELSEFEDSLVWRVAELLGVSTRDRMELKKEIEAGIGDGSVV